MKDALGDRMKSQYEDRTRAFLPRRTYTILRVDGKAFHTLTKGLSKPYDHNLMNAMDQTAIALCKEIQGAQFAYTQSDEISVLITDFNKITTSAWFDGNIQKMVSVAASAATAAFNYETISKNLGLRMALFDARVFTIPDAIEVENYFIWRQQDAMRNSVQMAARAVFSHKELEGKGLPQLHEMLLSKGKDWNKYNSGEKQGRCVIKREFNRGFNEKSVSLNHMPGNVNIPDNIVRHEWFPLTGAYRKPIIETANENPAKPMEPVDETPVFTQDRMFLRKMIPEKETFAPVGAPKGASVYDCG